MPAVAPRRFAARLFAAILLLASLVGAAAPCSMANAGAPVLAAGAPPAGEGIHHHGGSPAEQPSDADPGSECPAAQSCTTIAAEDRMAAASAPAAPGQLVSARNDRVPPSDSGAPEPPPPRA